MSNQVHPFVSAFSSLIALTSFSLVIVIKTFFLSSRYIRLITSSFLPIVIVYRGHRKKRLSPSGSIAAFFVGYTLNLAHWGYSISMILFFLFASKATNFRQNLKKKIEGSEFKEGGQRNWIQVICNGGVASMFALYYLWRIESLDSCINFQSNYEASWISVALLGSLACSAGDTFASELGSVLSKSNPILITTFRSVPRGTNGAISFVGLLVSALGGLLVGVGFFLTMHVLYAFSLANISTSQIHVLWLCTVGGLAGSVIDSILGATLQYSGLSSNKAIVEHSGPNIKHISGREILDNHCVNLLSSLITSLLLPKIAVTLL